MKKFFVIILILSVIFIGMVIYKNNLIGTQNKVNIDEVKKIEEYITKIYMWKEVTGEALPTFEDINNANDTWTWEVVNQNLENFEITYDEIESTAKKVFGEEFNKKFPKEGSETIMYNEENKMYYTVGMRTR